MNKKEFDTLYLGKIIHCVNVAQSDHFLELAKRFGYVLNNPNNTFSVYRSYRINDESKIMYAGNVFYNIYFPDHEVVEYKLPYVSPTLDVLLDDVSSMYPNGVTEYCSPLIDTVVINKLLADRKLKKSSLIDVTNYGYGLGVGINLPEEEDK